MTNYELWGQNSYSLMTLPIHPLKSSSKKRHRSSTKEWTKGALIVFLVFSNMYLLVYLTAKLITYNLVIRRLNILNTIPKNILLLRNYSTLKCLYQNFNSILLVNYISARLRLAYFSFNYERILNESCLLMRA